MPNICSWYCALFCFLLFLKEGTQKSFCWPCQKSLAPMSLKMLATPIIIIFINMTLVQPKIWIVRYNANYLWSVVSECPENNSRY